MNSDIRDANVDGMLEIRAEIPTDARGDVVRTATEYARTIKFD